MALLSKARNRIHNEESHNQLTRFKVWHVREVAKPAVDRGINPHGNLTRMENAHQRPAVEPKQRTVAAAPTPIRKKLNTAAELHATGPISIDVLRRALPLRFATIKGTAECTA